MAESGDRLTGVFGGSFDPPHVGHVLAVHYVLLTQPVSHVLVIPTARHPFAKQQTAFAHRLAMCRLAFESMAGVEVLDMESRREGPSYTIDTIRALQVGAPDTQFALVIGSDILRELDQWKESQELQRLVRLIVLKRLEDMEGGAEGYFLPRISSTELRKKVAAGESLSAQVPRQVWEYIQRHGLYADAASEA